MSRSYRKSLILTDSSTNHRYKPTRKQVASRITRAWLKRNPDLTESYKGFMIVGVLSITNHGML